MAGGGQGSSIRATAALPAISSRANATITITPASTEQRQHQAPPPPPPLPPSTMRQLTTLPSVAAPGSSWQRCRKVSACLYPMALEAELELGATPASSSSWHSCG